MNVMQPEINNKIFLVSENTLNSIIYMKVIKFF
jgi:hypothetical protein